MSWCKKKNKSQGSYWQSFDCQKEPWLLFFLFLISQELSVGLAGCIQLLLLSLHDIVLLSSTVGL